MDAKIDYLSFTILRDLRNEAGEVDPADAGRLLFDHFPATAALMVAVKPWIEGGSRGHYRQSSRSNSSFMTIWYGGTANHVLCELPGTACQLARDHGLLDQIVAETRERLTRIDIAVDIPNGCSPAEFVGAGYSARFEAHASLISPEGSTEYVGSMKSERFARVYRYNPPHPRAGTLRVEHVLRSSYAKAAAQSLQASGLVACAAQLGNSFAWKSPAWSLAGLSDGKLRASRVDRHEPGRVRWLHGVCIPALVKAHREGLVDIQDVCQTLLRLAV